MTLDEGGWEGGSKETEKDEDKRRGEVPCVPKSMQEDFADMLLLVVLYAVQGIPLGLTFGSLPFLLQQTVSYTDIGIFSFAGYPYSLKLLWSPVVDTFYSNSIGRRKSWIVPIQLLAGSLLIFISTWVQSSIDSGAVGIWTITAVFFLLIMLAATQDIAVDGWAVSLLTSTNTSYAATCQTVGLNLGYFMSFTVFLALNSPEFCNKYIRSVPTDEPFLAIASYLQLCGWIYVAVTVWLFVFKREKPYYGQLGMDNSLTGVYEQLWKLASRPHVLDLIFVMLTCKVGFAAAENITALELLQRGFKKEDLAMFVILDFPLQIVYAVVAGKLASGRDPLWIWVLGYQGRLAVAFMCSLLIAWYPTTDGGDVPLLYWLSVLLMTLCTSAMSTMMFVSQGGFFARISDSAIGGTYLTLLNTVSNLGGTWPTFPVMFLMDFFESTSCIDGGGGDHGVVDCTGEGESVGSVCQTQFGGTCKTENQGFFMVNILCVFVGAVVFVWIRKKMQRLQKLPSSMWNIQKGDRGAKLAREGTTPRQLASVRREFRRSRASSRTFLVHRTFAAEDEGLDNRRPVVKVVSEETRGGSPRQSG